MDREKVIKGLHYCTKLYLGCKDCPYFGESDSKATCECKLKTDASNLLKEQEAVKPKSKSRHGEYPQIVHRCGNCNEILYRYYKHCPTCGKLVKWG